MEVKSFKAAKEGVYPPPKEETIQLLKELLSVYSPSGKENEAAGLIAERLKRNFTVKKQKVGKRFNVIASCGRPDILLTAHIDTVPGNLKLQEDKYFIYGRGSCDAKGSVSSMITAAECAIRKGAQNFALLFDVGEELSFDGVLAASKTIRPKLVVVGEPSNMQMVTKQKGLLQLSVSIKGRAAPAATPYLGRSANDLLLKGLCKLKSMDIFGNGEWENTLNIGLINGGSAANVVSASANAVLDIRTIKDNPEIMQMVSKVFGRSNVRNELDFPPVISEAKYLSEILNVKTKPAAYFTEMYFWSRNSKAVVLGPGDYSFAHTDNERIAKKELIAANETYTKVLMDKRIRSIL